MSLFSGVRFGGRPAQRPAGQPPLTCPSPNHATLDAVTANCCQSDTWAATRVTPTQTSQACRRGSSTVLSQMPGNSARPVGSRGELSQRQYITIPSAARLVFRHPVIWAAAGAESEHGAIAQGHQHVVDCCQRSPRLGGREVSVRLQFSVARPLGCRSRHAVGILLPGVLPLSGVREESAGLLVPTRPERPLGQARHGSMYPLTQLRFNPVAMQGPRPLAG